MAKKKTEIEEPQDRNGSEEAGSDQGESIAGYFRQVFTENPRLLRERSNDELYSRWLHDHPGHDEVPKQVRTGLQNIKSVLRKKLGKRKTARQEQTDAPPPVQPAQQAPRRVAAKGLEQLEEHIDECLRMAKELDRDGLAEEISLLRQARNRVVMKHAGG